MTGTLLVVEFRSHAEHGSTNHFLAENATRGMEGESMNIAQGSRKETRVGVGARPNQLRELIDDINADIGSDMPEAECC